ncbi:MAG: thymidine phosphorylase [Erysipelothrix sp.]|nr:thymidine phosphorylase [Erysipelothrix sp.]
MNIVDIITKKRDHQELNKQEINYWITGVIEETIPEYQTSALLMAIVLNGMNEEEIGNLTESMMHSGDVVDLSGIEGIKVDKHSTGGVGDKTSIVLGPLVAAAGGKVAKMSGRGLGHTGGTLDKLESIEGFNPYLNQNEFIDVVNKVGCAIIGQSENLVKADKILYSLRDVTGTVDSIALIASSIMSKKLASGSDAIVLDVKIGEGAFMKDIESGRKLAKTMIAIGKHLNRDVRAVLSNMNQPLGRAIGNSLEVIEAIETLQNRGPKEFEELCINSAAIMLTQGKQVNNYEEGRELALETLRSGKAFDKLVDFVEAQGGNSEQIKNTKLLPMAKNSLSLKSNKTGWISDIDALELGKLSMHLGGGRVKASDSINHGVGLVLGVHVGSKVNRGHDLVTIYYDEDVLPKQRIQEAYACFTFSDEPVEVQPVILEMID